jgi:hypothetical protein
MKLIPLTQGKFAQVDNEDFEWLNRWDWYLSTCDGKYYAERKNGIENVRMHREIMGCMKGDKKIIDHIDRNGLNNQRDNLRLCTSAQNQFNKTPSGISKYLGVCWNKQYKKWKAQIRFDKKLINIGHYENEIDAAIAYNAKAKELHGEFANLNKI